MHFDARSFHVISIDLANVHVISVVREGNLCSLIRGDFM